MVEGAGAAAGVFDEDAAVEAIMARRGGGGVEEDEGEERRQDVLLDLDRVGGRTDGRDARCKSSPAQRDGSGPFGLQLD